MSSPARFPWLHRSSSRIKCLEESSGFPRGILALFLGLATCLGLLISWALSLSVQVQDATAPSSINGSLAAGTNSEGVTLLSETNIGAEVQLLIDTGTLQNPANFDVAACLDELNIDNSVLVLEQVSWENEGTAWLVVHSPADLSTVRSRGGEVSAAVVRSNCGAGSPARNDTAILWSGTVLVAPQR